MSARRPAVPQPLKKRSEPARVLPTLFGKNQPPPALLDPQAVALAEMRHELLFAISADRGIILDANPSALRLLGVERESAIGRPLADVLHLPEISQYLADLPAGRPVRFTQRMSMEAQERLIAWEFRAVRMPPPSIALALVAARPLEERRSAAPSPVAQQLQSLPAASRRAVENADPLPLMDWLVALPGVTYAVLFGIPEQGNTYRAIAPSLLPEGLPKTFSADTAPADGLRILPAGTPSFGWIDRTRAAAILLYAFGNPARPELLVMGANDLDSANALSAILPAFAVGMQAVQLTRPADRARPEIPADTSLAHQSMQALMDELPQALVLIHGKDGRVGEASLSCEQTLGYASTMMASMRLEDWLIAPEAIVAVRAACETGRIHESSDVALYRRGGEEFPAQVRAIPLPSSKETSAHDVLVIITDMTANRDARQESRHLQRQAVLGWMAASFAHEIRNPLNNLSLQLEEIRTLHKLAPEVEKLALESQMECQRLTEISRRMLDFARGQDFRPAPTDMSALVRRVLQRMQPALDRNGVRSLFSAADDLPPAMADSLSIEQVILNLIENASKAMPEGGHLGVSLQLGALESGAPAVEVRVADTGQGLPPQVREKLFQPYITTRADGHGLGLALSRHIIDAHRGALRAETYPGSGTVFRVFLPVA
jgi:PAS domain S-box-containing protein